MLMLIGLSLLTPVLAIAVMLSMAEQYVPEPLIALASYRGSHVRTVLTLEKLVPPPPLPPAVFLNTERPNLETADRDWNRLHPDFLQQALRVFARMEARGFPLALLEGYRSPERQDRLADMGAHVTQARAFQSKHQFGQALDAAPLRQGQLVISERDPWAMQAYQALGEEADREGLIWGGRWSMKDYGHIESAQGRR
ncbi:peptidoglycan L-alanyl-D-glutamate endopeptidase CwlK [Noviherbaspirillum humi]|uniref:Peptidoglycan L-alanyl-D-glutamate endopeptidase CwlK n=1 Tax=Noviherbaspirillum humi TaxID=1688639 RepID=A0A239DLP5_9BURK|nr:M15 family metallopeptidase [Noviherbaspirillum humi]SNS32564.1 peptidoglycan L-alanyl-D-glutamate endopeptidase CwlK [Noviherbaspirillum humi]